MTPTAVPGRPELPPQGRAELPDGRVVTYRDAAGPPGAATVLLIPGLMLTSDLNWFGSFAALATGFRVIAADVPGNGSLEDRADDLAALVRVLDLRGVVPVGYSMGGLIAQLLWHRHPRLVDGLVLCCTARGFRGTALEQLTSLSLPGIAAAFRFNPFLSQLGSGALGSTLLGHVADPARRRWAQAELDRTPLATTAAALDQVSRFTSHRWIGQVDVPTAVVVTTRDSVIPPARQHRLAAAIPGALVFELAGGHGICVNEPDRLAAVLLSACSAVSPLAGTRAEPTDTVLPAS